MSEILPFPSQKGEGRGDVVQCLIVRCGNRNVVFAELHCLEGGNVVLRYAYSDKKV